MSKCPNCGAPMQEGVCSYCHYVENREGESSTTSNSFYQSSTSTINFIAGSRVSSKSKMVAFFLCLFFGFVGAHKSYVGKVAMGVVYCLTMGIFGFGWLVDLVLILIGSFKDSNNLPLK